MAAGKFTAASLGGRAVRRAQLAETGGGHAAGPGMKKAAA